MQQRWVRARRAVRAWAAQCAQTLVMTHTCMHPRDREQTLLSPRAKRAARESGVVVARSGTQAWHSMAHGPRLLWLWA